MTEMTLDNFEELSGRKAEPPREYIKVGVSTCGIAAGAQTVYETLQQELEKRDTAIPVLKCGCAGMCYAEPLVEVCVSGMPTVLYGKVDQDTALKVIRKHVIRKQLLHDHIYSIKDENHAER